MSLIYDYSESRTALFDDEVIALRDRHLTVTYRDSSTEVGRVVGTMLSNDGDTIAAWQPDGAPNAFPFDVTSVDRIETAT